MKDLQGRKAVVGGGNRRLGEHVATLLSDAKYDNGVVDGLKGDTGISLDGYRP